MTKSLAALSAALMLTVAAAPLAAQAAATPSATATATQGFRWGPQVSWEFEGDRVGVGVRAENSLAALLGSDRWAGMPEFNWFIGNVNWFDFNYDIAYRFRTPKLQPYVGGGLNASIVSGNGNTNFDVHLNAIGGLKFKPMGKVTPIVQLRYLIAGGDALILTGGILF